MKLTMLLFFIFVSSFAFAEGPSFDDCSYYEELENIYHCGPEGYPIKFGKRLCQRYLDVEPQQDLTIKWWFPRVRFCLQWELKLELAEIHNCEELKNKAFNIHVPCYEESGFCELAPADKLTVLKITGKDALNPEAFHMILKVNQRCR